MAVTNILWQTKSWFAFSKNSFCAGTKYFEEALNAVKFLDRHKTFWDLWKDKALLSNLYIVPQPLCSRIGAGGLRNRIDQILGQEGQIDMCEIWDLTLVIWSSYDRLRRARAHQFSCYISWCMQFWLRIWILEASWGSKKTLKTSNMIIVACHHAILFSSFNLIRISLRNLKSCQFEMCLFERQCTI